MGLYDAARFFGFEVESSDNLRFIPLAVRFNLDRFGMRITLDQWQQLPYDDRVLLARFPVEDDAALEEMMKTHLNAVPEKIAPDREPVWARGRGTGNCDPPEQPVRGERAEPRSLGQARPLSALCARETLAQHRQDQPRFPTRDA